LILLEEGINDVKQMWSVWMIDDKRYSKIMFGSILEGLLHLDDFLLWILSVEETCFNSFSSPLI
jgi:hypothetical protein